MGIQAATAYLTRIHDAHTKNHPEATGAPVVDPHADPTQRISQLLAVGQALRANMTVITHLLIDPADDADAVTAATAQADAITRRKKPRVPRPIRLQPRDLDMLHTLGVARLLTVTELEWLHFPGWRTRYKSYLIQQRSDSSVRYRVISHLYHRLDALVADGYVQRITRSTAYARTTFTRMPNIYMLTQTGAELLATMRDLEPSTLCWEDVRRRSIQNLEHSLAIAQVYAALRCTVAHVGNATLTEWQGDHLLARPQAYDRLLVRGYPNPLPLQPDGTCVLTVGDQPTRVFLEFDRGTRPLTTWTAKIAAYHAYQGSPQLQARYNTDHFRLLIIAPTPTRLTRIAKKIITCTRTTDPAYWLTTADLVHPGTIRTHWQQIGAVTWKQRRLPQGSVDVPHVTLQLTPLWTNPSVQP